MTTFQSAERAFNLKKTAETRMAVRLLLVTSAILCNDRKRLRASAFYCNTTMR